MKIGLRTAAPLLTACTILSGCMRVSDRAYDYCVKANKTAKEYNEIVWPYNESQRQARLDSMAYRDIFEKTAGKDDKVLTKKFEDLADRLCIDSGEKRLYSQVLLDENISLEEYANCAREANITNVHGQHYGDNWAYRNFFEKQGLMNDSIKHLCDSIQEIIKP